MTTTSNIRKIGLAGILISILGSSCNKDLPACRGNCDLVTFSGNVSEFSSGQPAAGQNIKVILETKNCVICSTLNVVSGNSDANGQFELKKEIDTTLLHNYSIRVELTPTDGYITKVAPSIPSPGTTRLQTSIFSFFQIDSALDHILFKIYSKSSLLINLHRKSAIIPGREFLALEYHLSGTEGVYEEFEMNAANTDTAILVTTGANVFTLVSTGRIIANDSLVNTYDSIKCIVNGRNSIDISY